MLLQGGFDLSVGHQAWIISSAGGKRLRAQASRMGRLDAGLQNIFKVCLLPQDTTLCLS